MRGESRHARRIRFPVHRVEADELDALGRGLGRVGVAQVVEAQVADVATHHHCRRAGHLDGPLYVHAPHRPARADEQRPTARLERRAHRHIGIGTRHVMALRAHVDPAVVVHAADVHVDLAAQRLCPQQRDHAEVGQVRADPLDQVGVGVQQHDVVDGGDGRMGQIVHVEHFHAQRGCLLAQGSVEGRRHVAQQQPRRMTALIQAGADGVVVGAFAAANDPRRAAWLEHGAIGQAIGRGDAGPRLGQRALHVAGAGLDGEEVVAAVAGQHPLVDDIVQRQAALDLVAVGVAHAVHEHIGLDGEAVADVILLAQVFAHADHGHGDFVAQRDRVGAHVAVDARVLLAQSDDFDVGEAQPAGVVAHQQLARPVGGHGYVDGLLVQPQVVEAGAVQRPEAVALRQRRIGAAEVGEFVGHGLVLGTGRLVDW